MAGNRWAAAACWFVLCAAGVSAQKPDFDDLARRASDALDTRPQEAAALYEQALKLRPGWAEGWLYRGAALFELRRFREARDSLRKGVALGAAGGTSLAFLGMAEYETGEYQDALAHILKAEALGMADRPAFLAAVRYRAALIYLRLSEFPSALEQLRPLARHGIQTDEVNQALGLSVLNLPYLPSTLPPEQKPLVDLAGRAAWAYLAARAEDSKRLFGQLTEQFPHAPGVHYMNGVFLLDLDAAGAEREFRQELRISPSHVLARVQLALLLSKGGSSEEAVELAKQAAKLAPSDAFCAMSLGRVLLDAGRTGESIAALERAEKLAPQAARTHFYLANAYRLAGRAADAGKQKAEWERLRAEQEPAEVARPDSDRKP
jgi:tetratricopeptide (TPR) repeat protein